MEEYTVALYYKYVEIAEPETLVKAQKELCARLTLKGRIIIAAEGINGTLEGTTEAIEQYITETTRDPRFANITFKKSRGDGHAFPKLSVKLRDEIVSGHLEAADVKPWLTTGKYLSAEELHQWFLEGKEFYIIDMRNDFEAKVGMFECSILPGMDHFRELPKVLPKLQHLRNKTIVTVCTGGVRCEKASGYLVTQGFNDVYQLKDGIVTYMEKYPNEHFKGKLYVFDGRLTMGFNVESPEHEVIGKCELCGAVSENYVNCTNSMCHRHFIACENCVNETGHAKCPGECRVYHPERL